MKKEWNFKIIILLSVIVLVAIFLIGICVNEIKKAKLYSDEITLYSLKYDVEPSTILSIIRIESNFDNTAMSRVGAVGLMQIMENTAKHVAEKIGVGYSKEMLVNAQYNINLGTYYFSYLYKLHNYDMKTALYAYNGGEGNVAKWLKDSRYSSDGRTLNSTPYGETNNYAEKFFRWERFYKAVGRIIN